MSAVCPLDPATRESIVRELKPLAAQLRREFDVEAVYAFGSFARGEEHEGSDIDLLVVAKLPRRTELQVEPILVSRATFENRGAAGYPLFGRIAAEAIRLA